MSTTRRIDWIDFGKGFTIFLVVTAHTLGGIYTHKIYNSNFNGIINVVGESLFLIIMPVFFSLSGYLYKGPKNFREYLLMLKKKAWNLLTPYIFFSFIYILINQISGEKNKYNWRVFFHIYARPITYLWFLYILFFIFILVGVFSVLKVNVRIQSLIYIFAFVIIKIYNFHIYIFNVFGWAFFFCLGSIFRENINFLKKRVCFYYSLVLTILFLFILFISLGLNHKYYNNVTLVNIVPKIISDMFMFSLFLNFPKRNKIFSYFKKYGKYSLIIYMVHAPLLSVARAVILKIGIPNEFILIIILMCISWFGSLIVIWLNKKNKTVRFIFNAYSTIHQFEKASRKNNPLSRSTE